MKIWQVLLIAAVAALLISGCAKEAANGKPASAGASPVQQETPQQPPQEQAQAPAAAPQPAEEDDVYKDNLNQSIEDLNELSS